MKEKGAIILEEWRDVDWLLKTIGCTALENYKNRLREDIHTGANVPHMCDESFLEETYPEWLYPINYGDWSRYVRLRNGSSRKDCSAGLS